jgi:hypothetical protein
MSTFSRRSLLRAAGIATGAAVISASPAGAAAFDPGAVEVVPSEPIPQEPILAVIRNPKAGEVTILSGVTETTYTDKLLVKRLLKAEAKNRANGGVA